MRLYYLVTQLRLGGLLQWRRTRTLKVLSTLYFLQSFRLDLSFLVFLAVVCVTYPTEIEPRWCSRAKAFLHPPSAVSAISSYGNLTGLLFCLAPAIVTPIWRINQDVVNFKICGQKWITGLEISIDEIKEMSLIMNKWAKHQFQKHLPEYLYFVVNEKFRCLWNISLATKLIYFNVVHWTLFVQRTMDFSNKLIFQFNYSFFH